ncbi:class I SAM-dependent methyltransferase, partial [Candidatus Peribacteria bacterium]|nr:class I SAM-dependent methyltransferase [Candidatus Peribacteria bacterium]
MPSASSVFSSIYRTNEWKSGSGEGSLPDNTATYRSFLQQFLKDHHIRTVVDFGCGDWQSSKLIEWNNTEYAGIDVVPDIIRKNREMFDRPNVHFILQDGM